MQFPPHQLEAAEGVHGVDGKPLAGEIGKGGDLGRGGEDRRGDRRPVFQRGDSADLVAVFKNRVLAGIGDDEGKLARGQSLRHFRDGEGDQFERLPGQGLVQHRDRVGPCGDGLALAHVVEHADLQRCRRRCGHDRGCGRGRLIGGRERCRRGHREHRNDENEKAQRVHICPFREKAATGPAAACAGLPSMRLSAVVTSSAYHKSAHRAFRRHLVRPPAATAAIQPRTSKTNRPRIRKSPGEPELFR